MEDPSPELRFLLSRAPSHSSVIRITKAVGGRICPSGACVHVFVDRAGSWPTGDTGDAILLGGAQILLWLSGPLALLWREHGLYNLAGDSAAQMG